MTHGLEKLKMAEVFMEATELLEIAESLETALCPGVIGEVYNRPCLTQI